MTAHRTAARAAVTGALAAVLLLFAPPLQASARAASPARAVTSVAAHWAQADAQARTRYAAPAHAPGRAQDRSPGGSRTVEARPALRHPAYGSGLPSSAHDRDGKVGGYGTPGGPASPPGRAVDESLVTAASAATAVAAVLALGLSAVAARRRRCR
ncbi:hypothetical protein [Streptomyces sp. bgisy100]|uniref:hypothetical protein n=1 Tax=Streptomyces sp. bgisy100 TaxID=3413783 RepID=UPI003D74D884